MQADALKLIIYDDLKARRACVPEVEARLACTIARFHHYSASYYVKFMLIIMALGEVEEI